LRSAAVARPGRSGRSRAARSRPRSRSHRAARGRATPDPQRARDAPRRVVELAVRPIEEPATELRMRGFVGDDLRECGADQLGPATSRATFNTGTVSASPTHDTRTISSAARTIARPLAGGRTSLSSRTSSSTAPPSCAARRAATSVCVISSTTKSPAEATRSIGCAGGEHQCRELGKRGCTRVLVERSARPQQAYGDEVLGRCSLHGNSSIHARRGARRRPHGPRSSRARTHS